MDRQSEPPQAQHVAVIIAHGVGEADPGYAATTLSRTLGKCADFKPDEELKVRYLPDPHAPPSQEDRTFPVFFSSGELAGGRRVTFAELYWADWSRIAPSRLAAVLGFFRIIFESHHFVYGMLDRRRSLGCRILRRLLLIASWMLRGPIIGMVFAISALLWGALYVSPWVLEKVFSETVVFAGVSALLFIASSVALVFAIKWRDTTWYDPIVWTMVASGLLAAAFTLASVGVLDIPIEGTCPQWPNLAPDCRQNFIDLVYIVLTGLWRVWGAIVLAAFALAIGVAIYWYRRDPDNAPPVLTALGVVLLQFVLWTALVGTAAMPMIYRAEEVKGIYALQQDAKQKQVGYLPSAVAGQVSAQKLFKVVPWDPKESPWIDRLAFGYGFNGVMIASVLLIGIATHLRRYPLARRPSIGPERMPRMVIGSAILIVLMFVTFWQALYLVTQIEPEVVLSLFRGLFSVDIDRTIVDTSTAYKRTIMTIGWISTLALPVLASFRIGNFVHIARDLIDHQYSHKRASMLTQVRRSRDPELWPRRARIQARLETLLTELVQDGKYDRFIFAVHSQGSVITYDFLKDAGAAIGRLGASKPDIVTFGSPLAHLYQYYFAEYRDLEKDIMSLRGGIGRWVNAYRIDDYIGTDIDRDDKTFVDNRRIDSLGGHVDYWKEEGLAQIVCELATKPVSADAGHAEAPATT